MLPDQVVRMLPQFPRTPHLPWKANAKRDDLVCAAREAAVIFTNNRVSVEEKVDGSNCGMGILEGIPVIRNHNHIIHKGLTARTPAKMQFSSIWGWWYEHRYNFFVLEDHGPYTVYGEWCVAQHGIEYSRLPGWFVAHTLYDYSTQKWVDTNIARGILHSCRFPAVPLLHWGPVESYEQLEKWTNSPSAFADGACEGVYVKVCDGSYITNSFKMVRQGFQQGALWSDTKLKKNKCVQK